MEIKERLLEHKRYFNSLYESAKKKFSTNTNITEPLGYTINRNFVFLLETEYSTSEIGDIVRNLLEMDSLDMMLSYLQNIKKSRTDKILNNYGRDYTSSLAHAHWQCKFRVDFLLVTSYIPFLENMINEEKRRIA